MFEATDHDFEDWVKMNDCLVYFGAVWCQPCKLVKPILEDLEKELGGVKILYVNIANAPMLVQKLMIQSVPTFVKYKDGRPIKSTFGVKSKAELKALALLL